MENSFLMSEIEDVQIIISAKGKKFLLLPKKDKEWALQTRVGFTMAMLNDHHVLDVETIPSEKIKP
jgi:hypothetical protein